MKIAVLKGDGIGPEIVEAAQLVLNKVDEKYNLGIEYAEALFGGAAYDVYGNPYPQETQDIVAGCDAILLGSVGAPKYDTIEPADLRPEKAYWQFANLWVCTAIFARLNIMNFWQTAWYGKKGCWKGWIFRCIL